MFMTLIQLKLSQSQNNCWRRLMSGVKHQNINKNKHITLISDAYFPVRFRAQQRTKYNSLQLTASCMAAIRCLRHYIKVIWEYSTTEDTDFSPSLTLFSFKIRIEWPPGLTRTANFPSVLFQLLQYSRQRASFSAHRAAVMTKLSLFFQHFLHDL